MGSILRGKTLKKIELGLFRESRREMARLINLPSELLPTIKNYLDKTRLDWRTCKRGEASLIRAEEGESILTATHRNYELVSEMSEWTLAGRLFIEKTNAIHPGWHNIVTAQRTPPPPMADPVRWYLLQYRWLAYGPQENGGWN